MKDIDIYKQLYYDEISRKKNSDDKLSTTMLFISVYIAGFGLAITESSCLADKGFLWHFTTILISISLIAFILSLYFAIRTYFGYKYFYLTPTEIRNRHISLIRYYNTYFEEYYSDQNKSREQLVSEDLNVGLIENYSEASKNNFLNNNNKAKFYKLFSNTILTSLMILAIDLLVLYLLKIY